MKFRKKPIVIEAEQWFPPDNPIYYNEKPDRLGVFWDGKRWRLDTLEGGFEVTPGDWIIIGIKGKCYPCNQIFLL